VEHVELLKFALDALDRLQIPYALVGSISTLSCSCEICTFPPCLRHFRRMSFT
jgi:hypothetical protein